MSTRVNEQQGVLQETRPLADVIYRADGVVRLEDLVWPEFDPERPLSMAAYLGEIGTRMAETPREDSTQDSALGVYGKDFAKAEPASLVKGLYFPLELRRRTRPKKPVVVISERYCDLDRASYPGVVPPSTGVTVSEDLYEAIVPNAPYFSNRIANRTERVNRELVVEKREDHGGESALYALISKHELLEEHDQELLEERSRLVGIQYYTDPARPAQLKRIKNLETFRLAGLTSIQSMVRLACKGLSYGTNETQDTLNAVASNIHRSPEAGKYMHMYSTMAIGYNDAVRGKINQSIHGIGGEIAVHSIHAINNVDREYTDKSA